MLDNISRWFGSNGNMFTICDLGYFKTSTCTMVITRPRRFYLAIVDPRVDRKTPGGHLGVKMHAHSREATSHLVLGPGVRCRMLDRPQMMWGFHKYRLEPWGRPIAPGRMY